MAAMERNPIRDTLTDEDLIRMVRDGDADAFDVLFIRHHIGVYNFACTMLGSTQAAEDTFGIDQPCSLTVSRSLRIKHEVMMDHKSPVCG